MNKQFALAVLSVLVIAGCVADTSTTTSATGIAGLTITEFSMNPADVRQDQTVLGKMTIENTGNYEVGASDYFALLIAGTDWQFIGSDTVAKSSTSPMRRAIGDQQPVPRTFTWSLKAPKSQGVDAPVDFTGRIYYKYETEATGTVTVYPSSEADRATQKSEFSSSAAPIELSVEVNPDPPVIYANGDEFTLTIHVKNKGNGIVYSNNSVSATNYNIDSSSLGKVLIPTPSLPSGLSWSDPSCFNNIQFFGTSKEEITTCAIKVNTTPAAKTPYKISIKAAYGYYDEAKARVILKAR